MAIDYRSQRCSEYFCDNSVPDLGFSSDPLLSTLRFQSVDHARHCCSARTWQSDQSDMNLGGKTWKNHWNWYHYVIVYHSTYFNMISMVVQYPCHGAHHLRWLQQLLGWCHATATAHWDPPPYFPDWWPRATNAWQIWQMHLEKKKSLEKPVTIWQKVDYKML